MSTSIGQLLPTGIVRRLARHDDAVHMAFAQARTGDAHEFGALVQVGDRLAAGVAHGGAQAADDLMYHPRHRTFVGHLPFDTFWNELESVSDFRLEIAVG